MYTSTIMARIDLDARAHKYFLRILKEHFKDEPGRMAKALGEGIQVVSDLKARRRRLTHNYIERISDLINVDPMEFFKGADTGYVTEVHEEKAVWRIREAKHLGDDVVQQIETVTDSLLSVARKKGQTAEDLPCEEQNGHVFRSGEEQNKQIRDLQRKLRDKLTKKTRKRSA